MRLIIMFFYSVTLCVVALPNRPPIRLVCTEKPPKEFTLRDKKIAALEVAAILNEDVYKALLIEDPVEQRITLSETAEYFKSIENTMTAYLTVKLNIQSTILEKNFTKKDLKQLKRAIKVDYANIRNQHARMLKGLDQLPEEAPARFSIQVIPPTESSPNKKAQPIDINFLHAHYKKK